VERTAIASWGYGAEPRRTRFDCIRRSIFLVNAVSVPGSFISVYPTSPCCAGMYSHIKSLAKAGATDIPVGTSIETAGAAKKPGAVVDTDPAKSAVKTSVTQVGRAKVAGFAGGSGGGSALHHHEDSFQRRKGVVNTIGGAKDVTRQMAVPLLPPKAQNRGATVVGFDTLPTLGAEGKARREGVEKRAAAAAGACGHA
jgi:hypothetical protein